MKKFITAAALLAASTALANAATAVVLLDFETTGDHGIVLTNKGTNTSATVAVSGGYVNYGTAASIGADTYADTAGYTYYNSANYINVTNVISWDSDWSIALAFKPALADDWADILSIGDTSNAVRVESGARSGTSTRVGLYGTGIFDSVGASGSDYVLTQGSFTQLTLVYSQSSSSLSLYADGALQTTISVSSTESLATAIYLGGSIGGNGQFNGGYDEFAIYDAALTADEISTYLVGNAAPLTISTIPEPSAFGLLAGAGALALVAARRRRSRKA